MTSSLDSLVARGLPTTLARRLLQKKVLWFVRMHELDIQRLHYVDLIGKFSSHGLDLRELRAVWAALPNKFENDPQGEKRRWKQELFHKLEEQTRTCGHVDAGTVSATPIRKCWHCTMPPTSCLLLSFRQFFKASSFEAPALVVFVHL